MKFYLLVLPSVFGLALTAEADCDSQIQQYHECQEKLQLQRLAEAQKDFEAAKPKIYQCYISNGCTPPRPPPPSSQFTINQKEECRKQLSKVLRNKAQDCVRKTAPSYTFPPEQEGLKDNPDVHYTPNRKKVEIACGGSSDKADDVQDCIWATRSAFNQTDEERRWRFFMICHEKKVCDIKLDNCHGHYTNLTKTICQCNEEVRTESSVSAARASIPECAHSKGRKKAGTQQYSCDGDQEIDWCTEGYEAWQKNQRRNAGGGGSGR